MAKSMDSISTKTKKEEIKETPVQEEKVAKEEVKKAEPVVEEKAEPKTEEENTKVKVEEKAENKAEDKANPGSDSYESMFPEPSVVIGSPPSWIWWVVLIVSATLIAVVGFKLLDSKLDQWLGATSTPTTSPTSKVIGETDSNSTATASPSASATPTATPTPEINKSSITIRILNGTSVNGAASLMKSKLEKAGYSIRTVGNAAKNTYTQSIIYYQAGNKDKAELIKTSLNDSTVTTEESTTAAPDDILIIYGSK